MIVSTILNPRNAAPIAPAPATSLSYYDSPGYLKKTDSGQKINVDTSKNVATIYRAANIISDDIAKLPFQTFISLKPGSAQRVRPDYISRNNAYLMEVAPNRWMSPFIFKKTVALWLFFWGNAYIWSPPVIPRERFILASNVTTPYWDKETGDLWYQTFFPYKPLEPEYLPAVEVLPLIMNSDDGIYGRSMITFARETIGRRMGQGQTMDKIQGQGLSAAGIVWVDGDATKEMRAKIRQAYGEGITGSAGAGSLAVFDKKFTKFEQITMKATDMEFLQSAEFTDADLANFANIPLHKLNKGKQSYESNDAQNLDYLGTTIDPYLVQLEQAAPLKWLRADEQTYTYFRFERGALLRTDAKTRGEYLNGAINNGRMTPNEGRQIEDRPAFDDPAADQLYMNSSIQPLGNQQGVSNANQT